MTLDELMETIAGSSVEDWLKLDVHTVYGWEYGSEDGQPYLRPHDHFNLAIYKPDVDISLAFGATVNAPFQERWVENFPDANASSQAVWLRYRGAVVNEWLGVSVDGGRYFLPMPSIDNGSFQVSRTKLALARLMFDLYGSGGVHRTLEEALARAQIAIVS